MLRSAASAAALLLVSALSHAEVATKEVTYKQGDTELQGFPQDQRPRWQQRPQRPTPPCRFPGLVCRGADYSI